jgi:hypothetical protein
VAAGSELQFQLLFSQEAITSVDYYARGIPRVINLLCEHALVSSFVDQRNPVPPEIVEEVARDFDLHIIDPLAQPPAQPILQPTNGDHPQLMESLLQALNTLVDRLNQAEGADADPAQERKP